MEIKELLEKQNEAFYQFKKEMEKGKEADQLVLENLQKEMDKYEVFNQELVKKNAQSEKENNELKERIDAFERKMINMPSMKNEELKVEMKAFEKFIKGGERGLNAEELSKFYLRTDINTDGGYLAPAEYRNEMLKNITEISPIRSIARVMQTNR